MGDKVDINKTCDAKSPNAEKQGDSQEEEETEIVLLTKP